MTTDSFFAVMCGGMIALLFGLVLAFAGYRLFLILLPIWGFFFGLALGAQSIQALFGEAFPATITSWVVGFIVAVVFAVLAYLFYMAAVAIVSFSLGYSASIGVLTALGLPLAGGFIAWLIAVVVGVALALVVLRFNIQKWVIEFATAFLGAAAENTGLPQGAFLSHSNRPLLKKLRLPWSSMNDLSSGEPPM